MDTELEPALATATPAEWAGGAAATAAFRSLQLSRRMRDYGQVLFTFVPGLKLVSGIIRLGGAPPPIASSNQNLSCNLTLSSPGQRLEFIQCFQQICIWLRNKLYICGWTEAWGSFDNEKTLKRERKGRLWQNRIQSHPIMKFKDGLRISSRVQNNWRCDVRIVHISKENRKGGRNWLKQIWI